MRPLLPIDGGLEPPITEGALFRSLARGCVSPSPATLDRVADLAARISAASAGYLHLTDRRLQWMRPGRAFAITWAEEEILTWVHSLTAAGVVLASDLRQDSRFRKSPLVARADGVRACAVLPIRGPADETLGMLYVLDARARQWDESTIGLLKTLSKLTGEIVAGWISLALEGNPFESHPHDQRYRELFENTTDVVYTHDLRGRITAINQAAERILGCNRRELLGQGIADLVVPEHAATARQILLEQVGGGIPMNYQLGFRGKDGREISLDVNTHLLFAQGQPVGLIGFGRQVLPDARVGAGPENRQSLLGTERIIEVLKSRIDVARAANLTFAVAMLAIESYRLFTGDVDRAAGDKLATLVAELLKKSLHRQEAAGTMGANRFLVVFPVPSTHRDAVQRTETILQRIRDRCRIDTRHSVVTTSAGLSFFPESGEDASSLISSAEAALFCARQHGSNTIRAFSPEDRKSLLDCLEVERSLQRAIAKKQLALRFQPLLGLDGTLDGLEVLLSWNHPDRGMMPAGQYIPIAEASGAIVPIGAWVLREACRQNAVWQKRGYPPVTLFVNVSALQFARREFAETVGSILEETGLSPEHLELEITESAIMRDIEQSVLTMTELRALGVRLSIDDFGTGYSSLSYIRRLPVNALKIDRSFLAGGSTESGLPLLQKIVSLARSVGLCVVAEGVETLDHFELIRQAGCDRVQGHLFGRPLSTRDAGRLLAATKHGPLWVPIR
jgi:PAS domain S-box-containing protein/diguanylate cyclase (GGDEF)-like protein